MPSRLDTQSVHHELLASLPEALASAAERDVLSVAATALAQLYPGIGYIRVLLVSQNYSPSQLLELCAEQRMAAVMAEVSSISSSRVTNSNVTGSSVTGSTSSQGIGSSAIGSSAAGSGAVGASGDSSSRGHDSTVDGSSALGSSCVGSSPTGSSNGGNTNSSAVGSSPSSARERRFTCSQQAAMRQGVAVFTPQLMQHTNTKQEHTDPEQQHSSSDQYMDWHALHQEFGLCSFASVSLMVGGTVHGVMLAAAATPNAFTASSMHLICTVAHMLAPYAAVMYKHQQIQSTRALLERLLPPRVVAAAIERLSVGGNSLVDLFVPTHHSFAPQG